MSRQERLKAELSAYVRTLRMQPCLDCEQTFPWFVMDFDHCRGEKVMDIAKMVRRPVARARLEAELAKCDLVCANCHRARTYARLAYPD